MNTEKFIYLDNNSTTRLDPKVFEAMVPYFYEIFGNSGSPNPNGIVAAAAVEHSRNSIKSIFKIPDGEVLFSPSSTVSINVAIAGIAFSFYPKKNHLITQTTEHPAVLETVKYLSSLGFEITILAVDRLGFIDPEQLKTSITEKTILVSLMAANNEIGTLQPLEEAGRICSERGVYFHSDVTQAAGRYEINAKSLHLDLISGGGHKIHGPKGIGYLAVRDRNLINRITPLYHGGGQENALFPGTLNVPLIVGLSEALSVAHGIKDSENALLRRFSDIFQQILRDKGIEFGINGPADRLANNLSVVFKGITSSRMLSGIRQVAFSAGSACSAGSESHVLKAIGLSHNEINSTLRFGFSRFNTESEVVQAAEIIANFIKTERKQ